ncbi:MAG TPA: LysR substrate-binding domain-containing protein [Polyangiales bacterium]|nr:LysR substrate-binding domain-containing protein [Polyangiales bacterium]
MHDFEPRLLRAFVAVAEELHFGRAAKRLHISQPPLSLQIRRLERQLDVQLFERNRRHVSLTQAGVFLLDRARHLLAEAERTRLELKRVAQGEAGVLAIGYTPTAMYELLPSVIPAFAKARPDVRLELIEMRSALQPAALREHRIEIGFACGPMSQPDLSERVLVREKLVAAVPAKHALARRSKITLRALAQEPIVLVRRDVEPAWADASRAEIAAAGYELRLVQETDTKLALLGLVAAGVGLSPVSSSMRHLGRKGVVFRALTGLSLTLPLVALTTTTPTGRATELLRLALRVSS